MNGTGGMGTDGGLKVIYDALDCELKLVEFEPMLMGMLTDVDGM